jgi:hypothetical protein
MKPFSKNFEATKERFTEWWDQRILDRMMIYVTADLPAELPPEKIVSNPEDLYLNAEVVFRRHMRRMHRMYYAGDAFPWWCNSLPVGSFYGAEPVFTERTLWHSPIIGPSDSYSKVKFSPDNKWWIKSKKMVEDLVKFAEGNFFVSIPDISSPLDTLEMLRGAEGLSLDMYDRPEEVKSAQKHIRECWRVQYDALYEIVHNRFDGSTAGCLPAWSPKRSYTAQCDFSGILSAEMFEDFVVPDVEFQCACVDHSLYHLDGPNAARHADRLLKIPRLNGIQWQRGINGGQATDWLPLLKKIQKAGKLVFVDAPAGQVLKIAEDLKPEGLFLATSCDTPKEADDLVEAIRRLRK